MKKTLVLISVLVFCLSFSAFARGKKRVNKRQKNQRSRIQQGVKSGQLNAREANRLRRGQQKINNYKQEAKADGLDRSERRKLERMQDRQSKKIYKEKHDGQTRETAQERRKQRRKKKKAASGQESGAVDYLAE